MLRANVGFKDRTCTIVDAPQVVIVPLLSLDGWSWYGRRFELTHASLYKQSVLHCMENDSTVVRDRKPHRSDFATGQSSKHRSYLIQSSLFQLVQSESRFAHEDLSTASASTTDVQALEELLDLSGISMSTLS